MNERASLSRVYPRRNYAGRTGFTLLEVLVSLAIFALAAIVLSTAYVGLLGNYEAIRRGDPLRDDLTWVRRAMLVEPDRQAVETGGDVVLPGDRTARWSATIQPTEVSDLFDVALVVEIPVEGEVETLQFHETHRLLRPTWSEPAEREELRQAARRRLEQARGRM